MCLYGILGREITKYTAIYGACIYGSNQSYYLTLVSHYANSDHIPNTANAQCTLVSKYANGDHVPNTANAQSTLVSHYANGDHIPNFTKGKCFLASAHSFAHIRARTHTHKHTHTHTHVHMWLICRRSGLSTSSTHSTPAEETADHNAQPRKRSKSDHHTPLDVTLVPPGGGSTTTHSGILTRACGSGCVCLVGGREGGGGCICTCVYMLGRLMNRTLPLS